LLSIVLREKETAEKKYFESLIESATTAAFTEPQATKHCSANRLFDLSPIEAVLRKHLKKTLVAYEEYLVKLKQDCIRSQEECCLEERKRNQSLGVEAETKVDYEHQKELIRQQFDSCATMLAESYDQYLSEQLVPPSLVPVNVSMTMAGRGTTFHLIKVLPSDSTVELRETLTSLLESRGEKVISVEQAQFVLIGPFAKERGVNIQQWDETMQRKYEGCEDVLLLPDGCRPILQHGMKPGSQLCVVGTVILESDLPKVCFATTFQKNSGQKINYFKCNDCGFGWICQPCQESCHKGHNTVIFIPGHIPTWACCYCPKKKKCQIQA
jgi:hypothetical protein